MPTPVSSGAQGRGGVLVAFLALTALTWAVFLPVGRHAFIAFDDGQYVSENPVVREGLSLRGLRWAFGSAGYASNWHPLTWVSHMTDVELFGLDPGPHHLVNLLVHSASAVVLLLLCRALTGSLATGIIVAALFAVHPLHVESVAWVSERKDVLSGFFFFLATATYLRALRTNSGLLPTIAVYSVGLLAKPMLITLPVVLLLLDYWPLGRWRVGGPPPAGLGGSGVSGVRPLSLFLEKAPLFLLAALSSAVTIYAQSRGGGLVSVAEYPLAPRVLNAVVSIASYLAKTIWPIDLGFFYPHSRVGPPAHQVAVAAGVFLLMTAVAWVGARSRPHLPVGWGWFLVMLLPVIGFVQVGDQAMADRYTYLPLTGLFLAAATEALAWSRHSPRRRVLLEIVAAALVLLLAVAARRQVSYWRDSEILYRRAAEVTSQNWLAETGLGTLAAKQGRSQEARERYTRALLWRPDYYLAQINLGVELAKTGAYREAEGYFREAARLRPELLMAQLNLGQVLLHQGRAAEAVEPYLRAIDLDRSSPDAAGGLGTAYLMCGKPREALFHLEAALRLRPDYAVFRRNHALAVQALQGRGVPGPIVESPPSRPGH